MLKKINLICILLVILFNFSSCMYDSDIGMYELVAAINTQHGYKIDTDDFLIEKKENIIYHKMTDNNTLLSLYCNKNGVIIQCTLSCFDINNHTSLELLSAIGSVLTNVSVENFKTSVKKVEYSEKATINGWNITFIKNSLGITYIITQESCEISSNKPTLKTSG